MAKVAFTVTEARTNVGFDNLTANTKVYVRYYTGLKGQPKFATSEKPADSYPASTKGIYQLDAHKTAKGRILFPQKAILELRKDLVAEKHFTKDEVVKVQPGRFGTFWYNADGATE